MSSLFFVRTYVRLRVHSFSSMHVSLRVHFFRIHLCLHVCACGRGGCNYLPRTYVYVSLRASTGAVCIHIRGRFHVFLYTHIGFCPEKGVKAQQKTLMHAQVSRCRVFIACVLQGGLGKV